MVSGNAGYNPDGSFAPGQRNPRYVREPLPCCNNLRCVASYQPRCHGGVPLQAHSNPFRRTLYSARSGEWSRSEETLTNFALIGTTVLAIRSSPCRTEWLHPLRCFWDRGWDRGCGLALPGTVGIFLKASASKADFAVRILTAMERTNLLVSIPVECYKHSIGRLAQLVEHCDHTAGVTGSSPVAPTTHIQIPACKPDYEPYQTRQILFPPPIRAQLSDCCGLFC